MTAFAWVRLPEPDPARAPTGPVLFATLAADAGYQLPLLAAGVTALLAAVAVWALSEATVGRTVTGRERSSE